MTSTSELEALNARVHDAFHTLFCNVNLGVVLQTSDSGGACYSVTKVDINEFEELLEAAVNHEEEWIEFESHPKTLRFKEEMLKAGLPWIYINPPIEGEYFSVPGRYLKQAISIAKRIMVEMTYEEMQKPMKVGPNGKAIPDNIDQMKVYLKLKKAASLTSEDMYITANGLSAKPERALTMMTPYQSAHRTRFGLNAGHWKRKLMAQCNSAVIGEHHVMIAGFKN